MRVCDQLRHKIDDVRERIEKAAARAGRSADSVTLIAVTKGVSPQSIIEAINAGVTDIGENRIQEAQSKLDGLPPVRRHMIGHLQTNKVRFVPEVFDVVHSVDRLRLAEQLGRRLTAEGRQVDCLIQVNVSGEESKFGIPVAQALELIENVSEIGGLAIRGLMTMAPFQSTEKELRHVFGGLRELAERVKEANLPGVTMEHLSMGMTQDFEIAIEEGATMVRVGRAIFG